MLTLVPNNTNVANGCGTDYNALDIATNAIKIPFRGVMAHTIRVSYAIQTGSTQLFDVELRRISDNSVVGISSGTRNNDSANHTALFETYTNSNTDPFVTHGLYIAINNQMVGSITLTGKVNIYIKTKTR